MFFGIIKDPKFEPQQYEEFKYKLMIFWKLALMYEQSVLSLKKPIFAKFYDLINVIPEEMKFKIDQNYNLPRDNVINVYLKMK